MLALDVNLQQSWCGEELLTLAALMELQICGGRGQKGGSATAGGAGAEEGKDPQPTEYLLS